MRPESDFLKDLKDKYPNLFKEGSLRCGFHCPEGWQPLVKRLCSTIENQLVNFVPEEIRGEIYVDQVKEKFAGLRWYMNESTPFIEGAISLAESLSFSICETCGNPGSVRQGGYLMTLCDEHYALESNRRKEDYKKYLEDQKARDEKKAATQALLERSLKKD